jgi:ArsR family transcriptional regulator
MKDIERNAAPVCEAHELHRDRIEADRENMPPEVELYELSDFFKVLGDSTRMKILFAIDREPLCVCDIAELVGMTKSAVSHQLKILKTAKLVGVRREGKAAFYSLADDHVMTILCMGLEHINE